MKYTSLIPFVISAVCCIRKKTKGLQTKSKFPNNRGSPLNLEKRGSRLQQKEMLPSARGGYCSQQKGGIPTANVFVQNPNNR